MEAAIAHRAPGHHYQVQTTPVKGERATFEKCQACLRQKGIQWGRGFKLTSCQTNYLRRRSPGAPFPPDPPTCYHTETVRQGNGGLYNVIKALRMPIGAIANYNRSTLNSLL